MADPSTPRFVDNCPMDDIVRQAMAKWPNVPHCYGWLGLDTRGHWYMRDDRAQTLGSFASGIPGAKGALLRHDKLIAFIERNYAADPQGQWYFQNGPQRVYVELETTPWVLRVGDRGPVCTHTGHEVTVDRLLLDEHGRVYLVTPLGLGLVHTQDIEALSRRLETSPWPTEEMPAAELPARFGFVRSPQANAKPGR